MDEPRTRRYNIAHVMVLIAGLACLMAAPRLVMARALPVGAYVAIVVAGFLGASAGVGMVFGVPCPACGGWTLRRIARHRHFYRCSACRARVRRYWLGLGPWHDASGPEHDFRYRASSESRPWAGFAVPEKDVGAGADASDPAPTGRLLRNKRSRAFGVEGPGDAPPVVPGPGARLVEAREKVGRVLRDLDGLRGGGGPADPFGTTGPAGTTGKGGPGSA